MAGDEGEYCRAGVCRAMANLTDVACLTLVPAWDFGKWHASIARV